MKTATLLSAAAVLLAVSGAAIADHHMKGEAGGMKKMDTNGDGMISKDEFVKHHEMMYEKMKKNSAGMVDVKEMEAMYRDMARMHKDMTTDAKKK